MNTRRLFVFPCLFTLLTVIILMLIINKDVPVLNANAVSVPKS